MFDINYILLHIRPGAKWTQKDGKIIQWSEDNKQSQPTEKEIEEGKKDLEHQWKVSEYKRLRKEEYPEIGDQLDALYHAGLFPKEMADKLKAVKEKNPKPVVKEPKPELKDGN